MTQVTPLNVIRSPWIGDVEWDPGCELSLPAGLPGFEEQRRMLPVEIPAQRPLVYLQSLEQAEICFVCLPVRVIQPSFELRLSDEDRALLGIADDVTPVIGHDVLCLGLLVPSDDTVQVNLRAPIVISLHNARCIQSVTPDTPQEITHDHANFRLRPDGRWEALC